MSTLDRVIGAIFVGSIAVIAGVIGVFTTLTAGILVLRAISGVDYHWSSNLAGGLVMSTLAVTSWGVFYLTRATYKELVRKRVKPGHCGSCGYDMHGLAGGVCPECGSSAAAPPG